MVEQSPHALVMPQLWRAMIVAGCLLTAITTSSHAQTSETTSSSTGPSGVSESTASSSGSLGPTTPSLLPEIGGPSDWTSPERLSSSLQVMLMLTVVSLAPAVLLMTTSFVRIVVVLGLLRQALGTQQLPPSQVITSIALFVTLMLMTPVWTKSYEEGVRPYTEGEIGLEDAFERGVAPIRKFMADQIIRTDNHDDVYMFMQYLPNQTEDAESQPVYYDAQEGESLVPITALLPAFMLSELKTAFLIGFQIYLPFVILDIIVASVTISMGMLMLPPVIISLPFKLLLFVLLDGWRLVIEMLLQSFVVFT